MRRGLGREIGVFGSYVRGEATERSDVDILVDFYEVPSLLKFIELEEYLEKLLGIKVDLVMKSALKPKIGEHVGREVIYVWRSSAFPFNDLMIKLDRPENLECVPLEGYRPVFSPQT
ncbi:nucleotidyltransferase family protein [Thermococcus sp.]